MIGEVIAAVERINCAIFGDINEGRKKMLKWEKTGREVKGNGESTTYYTADNGFRIESRKKAIPHAGGRPGCWYHTTYFLIIDGEEKEFWSLKDAKEAAERSAS